MEIGEPWPGRGARRLRSLAAMIAVGGVVQATGCQQFGTIGFQRVEDSDSDEETDTDDSPSTLLPPIGDILLDVGPGDCEAPEYDPCDAPQDSTWTQVLGMSCPGSPFVTSAFNGHEDAITTLDEILGDGTYEARQGSRYLVLSNGRAADLPLEAGELGQPGCVVPGDLCPSTAFGGDPSLVLPAPLTTSPVSDSITCADDPDLVGTGDCSNSIHEQWALSGCVEDDEGAGDGDGDGDLPATCEIHDYADLRLALDVPEQTTGLSFDFAFMTVEYPAFINAPFNDMFIAWIESEDWTGNMSFDTQGNPISVRAGFLDYKASEELEGFAMEAHGGTRWLTSSIGVRPEETIELVFAIFDMDDGFADSLVLLDNLRWDCTDKPPLTRPVP